MDEAEGTDGEVAFTTLRRPPTLAELIAEHGGDGGDRLGGYP
ncbi:hypothetical protein [Streptomyces sp. NBC_01803]|nr:hypothetical protein [Streptomyces sp. NBC_01803]WSA44513.1 hypothetical protein OIE51_10030 [Streptomyces sp. NBC_01803]